MQCVQKLLPERPAVIRWRDKVLFCLGFGAVLLGSLSGAHAADAFVWGQHKLVFTDSTFSDNPFDVDLKATFTHAESNRSLTQFGFYAGSDTWKIFFMPTAAGTWEYITDSSDSDLDGITGTFTVAESASRGPLRPSGRRWQFAAGGFAQPVLVPSRQYIKATSLSDLLPFVEWLDRTVKANLLGTTLVYFSHGQEAEPYQEGYEGERFYLPVWNRLNALYDELNTRDIGIYIMFFSDDAESPSNHGIPEGANGTISEAEERLFKYAVARFGAYPTVIWDSGIDIGEVRSATWQEKFARWFAVNDPWGHAVGNRNGGGSGGVQPESATFYSDGAATLPGLGEYSDTWRSRTVPTIFTDRWREDDSRGAFDPKRIRQAVWQMSLIGGTGVYVSGNENGGYLNESYASDFKAAASVGYAVDFFRQNIPDMGSLDPRQDILLDGSAVIAASSADLVAYLPAGGSVTLDLSAYDQDLQGVWYNPRLGKVASNMSVLGGSTIVQNAPNTDDWVLWLTARSVSDKKPMPPESLTTE